MQAAAAVQRSCSQGMNRALQPAARDCLSHASSSSCSPALMHGQQLQDLQGPLCRSALAASRTTPNNDQRAARSQQLQDLQGPLCRAAPAAGIA